ncbi:TetR/AcrR family transcriptional regulator [uncultured Williamsia sp.]|uniref:TetR/AcrR family transcriptional regulator n=1 Tax=uncultured Williamsia sp. TaxID=259311 RepID=UPI0026339815|nr:TetR/AcrR family transcriptional regulator [uncultured Williamsia sp.]
MGSAADKPFHHGNLRAVLLDRAHEVIRSGGVDALSLRELARDAGVSHAAPRRHFRDRHALVNALAERGFELMTRRMSDAATAHPDHRDRFRALAEVFVDFAATEPALLDLMFTKTVDPPPSLTEAVRRFYEVSRRVVLDGHEAGVRPLADPERTQMLLIATLQGIATLVGTGRITSEEAGVLIDDTTTLFVGPADDR